MSSRPPFSLPDPSPPSPARGPRVEYLGFRDADGHREFRVRVYGADGPSEFRIRIARADFDARRVRMQDGPDLCYQKLLQVLAAGGTASAEPITIDDDDLSRYRDEHTQVAKRRSPPAPSAEVLAARASAWNRPGPPAAPPRETLPPVVAPGAEPALEEGQRVRHAVYGLGVTTATTSARTVVSFDEGGSRSFIASALEVEVLSPPHTWTSSPRGGNRPRGPGGPENGSAA